MCILFELCSTSLFEVLHESQRPVGGEEMLRVLREVALGVYYLHHFDPPILHLDLKSANVLIDEMGTAKVCDFGLSHELADQTREEAGDGSPQWTAPEKLRGESVDEKVDVYSYGILMYEVMARKLPYADSPCAQIVLGVLTGELDRPKLSPQDAERGADLHCCLIRWVIGSSLRR